MAGLAVRVALGLRPLKPTGWVCFSCFAHLRTALSPEGSASGDTCLAHPTCPGSALTHRKTRSL